MLIASRPAVPAAEIVETIATPFTLVEPLLQVSPCVVGVPHAGRQYPLGFLRLSRLSAHALRRSEDAFMDILASAAPRLGAPLLVAHFPRSYCDVNREPYELDPRMFEGKLPPFVNSRSMRVAGGLGTVPRVVGDGQDIYSRKLCPSEATERIERYYKPYHAALRAQIARTRHMFGRCMLLDLHSMPSAGLERDGGGRPDVVLGDRFGTSAAAEVVDQAEQALRAAGFTVARNKPYAGGHITEHYGQPSALIHALQIELNRALYMNEATLEPHPQFEAVRAALGHALALMFCGWMEEPQRFPLAAE